MLSLVGTPRAEADLSGILAYLNERNPQAAEDFLDALEKAFAIIALTPDLGSPWDADEPRLATVRYWQMNEFPNYLVFYWPVRESILIMRILHAARNIDRLL